MKLRWAVLAAFWAMLGVGQAATLNVVFDGDSISAGAGATPGQGLDQRVAVPLGASVRNVAKGGRPVSECLRLYPYLVAPLYVPAARNVIVFHAGDNDIARGQNAVQTYAAFTAYVTMAHRQGWKVVVSTELRRYDFPPERKALLEDYNAMLRRNEAGADAVVDLDTEPKLLDRAARSDPAIFTHDGVHPSDGGYAVLAAMLVPAVRSVVGR